MNTKILDKMVIDTNTDNTKPITNVNGNIKIPYAIENGKLTIDLGEITDIFLKVKDPDMGLQVSSNGNMFIDSLRNLILTSNWATDTNTDLNKVFINPVYPDTDIPVPRELLDDFAKDFHEYLKQKRLNTTNTVLENTCKCGVCDVSNNS